MAPHTSSLQTRLAERKTKKKIGNSERKLMELRLNLNFAFL